MNVVFVRTVYYCTYVTLKTQAISSASLGRVVTVNSATTRPVLSPAVPRLTLRKLPDLGSCLTKEVS